MTYDEAVKKYGQLLDFEKENPGDAIYWSAPIDTIGPILFSFDGGKTIYNVYGGSASALTEEQMTILRKENPTIYNLI